MEETSLVRDVMERMGAKRESEASCALMAVVETLGEHLPRADAAAIAAELPPEYAAALRGGRFDPSLGLDAFHARVARRLGVSIAFAREHAQAVCAALTDWLSPEARQRLVGDVWEELVRPSLRDLLAPSTPAAGTSLAAGRPGSRHPLSAAHPAERQDTLASGRPGSRHPLSEARPDRAQSGSVVASDNPHGDRKLSSGR